MISLTASTSTRNNHPNNSQLLGEMLAMSLGKIYKEKGDRWLIRLPNGTRIFCDKSHRSFYSRKHAEWTLAQIQSEIEQNRFDPAFYAKTKKSINSFEFYVQQWLSNNEKRLNRNEISPGYWKEMNRYVNTYFLPAFGPKNMQEIRGLDLKTFYLNLENISPKSIYNVMGVLKKIFRDAHEDEVIQTCPHFPRMGGIPEPETIWADVDEQDAVLAHLDENTAYFVFFLMTHGVRPGEGRALQHRDINLRDNQVVIRRAFSGTVLRPFTKTRRVRILPLDESWKELYLRRPRNINPEGFIFTTSRGKPFSMTWASKKWKEAAIKAGFPNLCLYAATRHSIASQAVNRDVSLYAVQKFLGHSTIKQTERYSHFKTEGLRKVQRQASVITAFQ